jgi:hypothetical protein
MRSLGQTLESMILRFLGSIRFDVSKNTGVHVIHRTALQGSGSKHSNLSQSPQLLGDPEDN